MYTHIYTILYKHVCHCIHLYIVCHCIHNMSNQTTQYVRKCKDCQGEILMKNLGDKWAALEKDGSTQHRCKNIQAQAQAQPLTANHKGIVTGGNESKSIEITPPQTSQSNEIAIHTTTNEDEIIALKGRVTRLENYLKKLSESYVMNQL
jgi:hypothetical protein